MDADPLPVAGLTVAHGALLLAVHPHKALVLTATVVWPPPAAIWAVGAARLNWHAAAAWAMVVVCSATPRLPCLVTGSALAATLNVTVPSPWPELPAVIWIQGT
jgi:hypothetical protein